AGAAAESGLLVAGLKNSAILLVSCPDRKGIVAAIAEFLYRANGNILHADQHQDGEHNLFLMRVEWDLADFTIPLEEFARHYAPIAERFAMDWRLARAGKRPRVAIFVSRYLHCWPDLLYRHGSGELACEIPLVISNHPDARRLAEFHKVPFIAV